MRILIVDDEKDLVELLAFRFRGGGFEVDTALDGAEALYKALADPPDVILLDLLMPRMDGWELFRRLRAEAATREVPVVVMTALGLKGLDGGAVLEALGVCRFLRKPLNNLTIVDLVRDCCRRPA